MTQDHNYIPNERNGIGRSIVCHSYYIWIISIDEFDMLHLTA